MSAVELHRGHATEWSAPVMASDFLKRVMAGRVCATFATPGSSRCAAKRRA